MPFAGRKQAGRLFAETGWKHCLPLVKPDGGRQLIRSTTDLGFVGIRDAVIAARITAVELCGACASIFLQK
jgi:hypothetical protein